MDWLLLLSPIVNPYQIFDPSNFLLGLTIILRTNVFSFSLWCLMQCHWELRLHYLKSLWRISLGLAEALWLKAQWLIIYLENMYVMVVSVWLQKRGKKDKTCSVFVSRLPVMCITFWFDAYSIIKLFSFSSNLYGKIFLVGRFHFNYISPTLCNLRQVTFNCKTVP